MSVTLYHNPNCGSSRTTLAALRAARIEPTIIEYLKVPLDVEALRALVAHMGVPVREIIRQKEKGIQEMKDTIASLSVQIAGRIIEKEVNAATHKQLVDSLITDLAKVRKQ